MPIMRVWRWMPLPPSIRNAEHHWFLLRMHLPTWPDRATGTAQLAATELGDWMNLL